MLFESLHHAREHLVVEEALRIIHLLVDNYRAKPANATNDLERRVSAIVKSREIWIVPMVNPDGGEWDISDPANGFLHWRSNRQPTPAVEQIGTDLNRNWGLQVGLLRRLERQARRIDVSRSQPLVSAGGVRAARLRPQPARRRPPADHRVDLVAHLQRAGDVAVRLYPC